uniref:Uncharacterized protein n=1 Tax=Triticum urartu TaxID=4572 RepID=A0A8R7PMN0_TRIUA
MTGRPTDLRQRGRRARRSTRRLDPLFCDVSENFLYWCVCMHRCCTILGAHSPRIPQVCIELGRRWRPGTLICRLHMRSREISASHSKVADP